MNKRDMVEKADRLVREILIIKFGARCQICKESFPNTDYLMQCHLLTKKAYPNLRHEFKNIVWGCNNCHTGLDNFSDPIVLDRIIELFGYGFKADLIRLSGKRGKLYMPDIIKELEAELEKLRND